MRKVSLVVALVTTMLYLTAVAVAATNTYTVKGGIASGGSKASPSRLPSTSTTRSGRTTAPCRTRIKTYKIHFAGLQVQPEVRGCWQVLHRCFDQRRELRLEVLGQDEGRRRRGSTPTSARPASRSTRTSCATWRSTVYAGGPKSLALYLHGDQSSTPRCIAPINQAIDAKLTSDSKGGALTFTVPPVLLRPVAGLDSGITRVTSRSRRSTPARRRSSTPRAARAPQDRRDVHGRERR